MTTGAAAPEVLIAGNPNSGKSTLFNALSGGSAHVGNYPGVTVDRMTATVRLSGHEDLVRGHQGVDGENAQAGGAVQQDEVIGAP